MFKYFLINVIGFLLFYPFYASKADEANVHLSLTIAAPSSGLWNLESGAEVLNSAKLMAYDEPLVLNALAGGRDFILDSDGCSQVLARDQITQLAALHDGERIDLTTDSLRLADGGQSGVLFLTVE